MVRLTFSSPVCFSIRISACSLLVNELETGIASVDSKKKIQIGSFRVDPSGNQDGLNEVPYARSEAHIYELLDNICSKSRDYTLVVHPTTGKAIYRRADITKIDGDKSRPTLSKLESACNDFLEDHEEELVKFTRSEHDDPVRQFCQQQLGSFTCGISSMPKVH
ncbi:unnamed protein product [Toxocara canis]|uniref:DUF3456 domain-containing protein n=1 Tax=Toxocara canis TaxID=6265 RepID=A0A183UUH3_TOXCA|nr:unnamed protein product [Toxocara canis]